MEVLRFSWGAVSAITFQLEGFRFELAEVLLSVCLPSVSLHGFSISALFSRSKVLFLFVLLFGYLAYLYWLYTWMVARMVACAVHSGMDWPPVQGVSYPLPSVSWDRLQLPCDFNWISS